jgi:hypothetical protein
MTRLHAPSSDRIGGDGENGSCAGGMRRFSRLVISLPDHHYDLPARLTAMPNEAGPGQRHGSRHSLLDAQKRIT